MKECILFDIDGTLADTSHRDHLVRDPDTRDFPAFFDQMQHDTPIMPVVNLLRIVSYSLPVILTTGRPETYRQVTEEWLLTHAIPHHILLMRPEGNRQDDTVIKKAMLTILRSADWNPLLVIDDRSKVVNMWRENGLICLQAAPGDF